MTTLLKRLAAGVSGAGSLVVATVHPRNLVPIVLAGMLSAGAGVVTAGPSATVGDPVVAGPWIGPLLAFVFLPGAAATILALAMLERRAGQRPAAPLRGLVAIAFMLGPVAVVSMSTVWAVASGPPSQPLAPGTWLALAAGPLFFGPVCRSSPAPA